MRFDLGESAGDSDFFYGVRELLMVTVGKVRGTSIKALENELSPELSGINIMEGSDEDGESSDKHEEFSQEDC